MMTTTTAAHALFASTLQPSHHPTVAHLEAAVRDSVRVHGGPDGCTAFCAVEYGDHPETAAARMRWARQLAQRITADPCIAA